MKFIRLIDERRVGLAKASLQGMLGLDNLAGMTFLDIGCGSGLFSLAARGLGAQVHSFDFDDQSVACTRRLKQDFCPEDLMWTIAQGSALDRGYLEALGPYDIVYSWGVLHHTGQMWDACRNAASRVKPGGRLFIAIYNDQGRKSRTWLRVKQMYNRLPTGLRWLVLYPAFVRLWLPTTLRDAMGGHPFRTWRQYEQESTRGMSPWRDVVDWVGGLPFEVASPERIIFFHKRLGFDLVNMKTVSGGHGCNEYVFRRISA
jgi:2-polyprenyl-6-hydroxyphenyl methylase/3-demethylubiquinone-9 3-methyltransferase